MVVCHIWNPPLSWIVTHQVSLGVFTKWGPLDSKAGSQPTIILVYDSYNLYSYWQFTPTYNWVGPTLYTYVFFVLHPRIAVPSDV